MKFADQRIFMRYIKPAEGILERKGSSLRAAVVDYSLGGVGVVVENERASGLGVGEVVGVLIEKPQIRTAAEVKWAEQRGRHLRLGLRNVGQIKGRVGDFMLADAFIGIQRSSRTGIWVVECGDITKKVYVSNGDLIFSSSNQPQDRLGDMLLKEGRITREQYERSVEELKRTKQRQGGIFVRLGYLAAAELIEVIRRQVEEIIKSLFRLPGCTMLFEEGRLPTDEVITLKLSAANLIYSGIRQLAGVGHLLEQFPSLESVPCVTSEPMDLFQDLSLDPSGRKVLSAADCRTALGEIIAITGLEETDARKTVFALQSVRLINLKEAPARADEAVKKVLPEEAEETQPITDAEREAVEEMHVRYKGIGYYEILGVKSYAAPDEVKSAYYRAAKKFHPDMHFYSADTSLKGKLGDIFSYVCEAYAVLSDPVKRKEYDKSLSVRPARLSAPHDKAQAAFEEGKVHLRKKEYEDAELCFGQAIYFDKTIAAYHYYYGQALVQRGKHKVAERAMETALKLEPHNADYLAELGFVHLALKMPLRARAAFEKALKIDPGNERASEGMKKSGGTV